MLGCAVAIVAANNLGSPTPEAVDAWNTLVVLFPCMLVFGCAFFFILLDRLNLQVALLNSLIVTSTLVITAMPLTLTLTNTNGYPAFPPYCRR